jgi:ABC-type branched-subunit amino acid transport system substrate-binding protein
MKRPAILTVNDSYGLGMTEFVESAIKNLGMEVAIRVECTQDEKQFTPMLTRILNSGADGIIAINHQDQAALVMLQVKAMDIKFPLMGCSQYASALAMDTAGEAANGWYSLADWTNEVQTPSGKTFVENYRKAYNRDSDMQSAFAYDAVTLLEKAIIQAGSDDPKAINEAMKKTKSISGVMTSYTYYEGDHSLGESIFLTQTQNKKGTMIDVAKKFVK